MLGQSIHERVVLVFPGALGDFLLALPALRHLRVRHATAHMTLVVSEPLRALALLAVGDATASLDAADTVGLWSGDAVPRWLAGRPVVYSWLGAGDAEVRRRLAAGASAMQLLRVERGPGGTHAARAYLRAVGGRPGRSELAAAARIVPPASRAADELWATIAGPVLAIHPGAGAPAKRWTAAGFAAVARWWVAAGGTVLGLAGPAEAGDPPIPGALAVRDWPLPDLAAVLGRVALYLGNDGGVSHLAGAVGASGVVLFGPTSPVRWRPAAGDLRALRAPGPEGNPLRALSPARVIAACRRHLP